MSITMNFMVLTPDSAYSLSQAHYAFTVQQVLAITEVLKILELEAFTQSLELDHHRFTSDYASVERTHDARMFQMIELETEL